VDKTPRIVLTECYLLHAGVLLDLFLEPEDRGDTFPLNVVDYQRTTWRGTPEHTTLHNHSCETLQSYISIFIPSHLTVFLSQTDLKLKYYFGVVVSLHVGCLQ
jgi:hypothetical protein